ncbi:hypothetical protein [Chryseobacterium sp. 2VB]|nr:hypothetical protein [Chryseobacterium sp. 2VB]
MKTSNRSISNSFDGLTTEERNRIKVMGEKAMNDYLKALQAYLAITNKTK